MHPKVRNTDGFSGPGKPLQALTQAGKVVFFARNRYNGIQLISGTTLPHDREFALMK
jgi:hypothetical protein